MFDELTNNNHVQESNLFFSKLNNSYTELINNLMLQYNYIIVQKNKEAETLKKSTSLN